MCFIFNQSQVAGGMSAAQLRRFPLSIPITNDDNAKFKKQNERITIYLQEQHLHEYGNVDVGDWSL